MLNIYQGSEDEDGPLEEVTDATLAAEVAAAQAAPGEEDDQPVIFAEQTILFDAGDGQDVELGQLSVPQLKEQLKRYNESISGSKADLQRRLSWQINKNSADPKFEHTIRFECTVTAKKRAQAPEGHFFVNVDYKGVKLKDIPIKIPDGIVNKDKIGVEIRFPVGAKLGGAGARDRAGGGGVGGRGPNGRRRQR